MVMSMSIGMSMNISMSMDLIISRMSMNISSICMRR